MTPKFNARVCAAVSALAFLGAITQASANALVLLCKGTEYCATCSVDQKTTNFEWTYTVDLSAETVDGLPAKITDERITWQLKGPGVLDDREISRFSKKFSFWAKAIDDGREVYHGDGICELQDKQVY